MKLAFYYHIPVFRTSYDKIKLPGYLGIFIDAMANEVELLLLTMHSTTSSELADYQIKSKNVKFIDLGEKTPAWHRSIYHQKILKNKLLMMHEADAMLVRSPSPLAPFFAKYLPKETPLFYYIVGNYIEVAKHMNNDSLRAEIIKLYLRYNNYKLEQQIAKTDTFVNSIELLEGYLNKAKSVEIVKSTTLCTDDFFRRIDTCQSQTIKILYTGRIDLAKGLLELVESVSNLIEKNDKKIELHIVGWEEGFDKPVQSILRTRAKKKGVINNIYFHGKKQIGQELNSMYQMSDIFVLPSFHEGFPRVIWEAMANSLPVIATSVGSIPSFLELNKDCLLIPPKSISAIEEAIQTLIDKQDLRRCLIKNGFKKASLNTLETQTKRLITLINEKL